MASWSTSASRAPQEKAAADMIVYAPRRVTLAPHEPQSIRIAARPPQGIPDGEYRVHLLFRAIPPAIPVVAASAEAPKGLHLQLIPIYGVTIPVIVRLGNLQATAGIANVELEKRDDKPAIGLDLSRSGTRSTFGEVRVYKAGVKDPIAVQRAVAVYTELNSRHVAIPIDEKYKGPVEGPVTVQYFETFEDGHAKARRNPSGAPLRAPGQDQGSGSCSPAASGCARRRCCWRSAPAASARRFRRASARAMDGRSRRPVPS